LSGTTANTVDPVDFAARSFDSVISAYRSHEENAGRILAGLAFLTAAAVALLSQVSRGPSGLEDLRDNIMLRIEPSLDPTQVEGISRQFNQRIEEYSLFNLPFFGDVNVPIFAFALYLFFALVATAFYLAVLWPSIEEMEEVSNNQLIKSRLFYRRIAELRYDDWESHWLTEADRIPDNMQSDFMRETFLLAHRAMDKERLARWGSWAFRAALVPLAVLALSLLLPDRDAFAWWTPIAITGLCVAFLAEARLDSDTNEQHKAFGMVFIILLMVWLVAIWHFGQ
jgi:hypothetical protein